MKFKLNDKVKMRTKALWWKKGDIGRIVDIDNSDDSRPYEICFDSNCTSVWRCTNENTQWVRASDIELVYPVLIEPHRPNMLMKVE